MSKVDELLKELGIEDGDKLSKINELVGEMVEAEKEVGKGYTRKKNEENKNLRESLKKLGYDHEKFSSVDEYLAAREQDTNMQEVTVKSLKSALDSMKSELAEEREAKAAEQKKRVVATVRSELMTKLAPKVQAGSQVVTAVMAETPYEVTEGGVQIGGVAVDDFITAYVADNSGIAKTNQENGSGTPPVGGASKSWQNMSLKEALKASQ